MNSIIICAFSDDMHFISSYLMSNSTLQIRCISFPLFNVCAIMCQQLFEKWFEMKQRVNYADNDNSYLHECQAEVVGSAAPVHWVLHDVEGKDRHFLIQQDAKIISWETQT